MAARPNIILITTDSQRWDAVGCYGNHIVRTPILAQMAAESCCFANAIVNNPVCVPSRACMQTGRYTHQHGLRYQEKKVDYTKGLPPWETTFMERLQSAGYYTAAIGKIHMYPPKGFHETHLTHGQGARWHVPYGSELGPAQLGDEYARWLEQRHPGGYTKIYEQRRSAAYKQNKAVVVNVLPTEDYIDTWITEKAMEFVSGEREQPFFLWYGLCNPHPPIDPPQEYADLYDPAAVVLTDRFLKGVDPAERSKMEAHVRRRTAYFWGLCTYVDDMMGRVFRVLQQKNLWDNTVVIFTSDHGEMMGDHGLFGKQIFYEGAIHVPLVVKPPADGPRIPVVSGLVEVMDVAATVLDYAGLPIPCTMEAASLRPAVEGKAQGKEMTLCEYTPSDQSRHGKCIQTGRFKYQYWAPGGQTILYDHQEDPYELRNVADDPAYAKARTEMHEMLVERLLLTEKPILYPTTVY